MLLLAVRRGLAPAAVMLTLLLSACTAASVPGAARLAAAMPASSPTTPAISPMPSAPTPPTQATARMPLTPTSTTTPSATTTREPRPVAKPDAYRVVGLGDSVPSGYNCDCANYVSLYAAQVERDTGVRTTASDDAVDGAASADVLHQLQPGTPVADSVARADFVVLNVGANDFAEDRADYDAGRCGGADHLDCFRPQLSEMRASLSRIVQRIGSLTHGRPVAIRVVDYWNVFEDGGVGRSNGAAFVRDTDRLTRLVDDQICAAARDNQAVCVRTYAAFKGASGDRDATPLLASDGDHPNAQGHRLLARLVAGTGYAPVI